MKFIPLSLSGSYLIEPEYLKDDRGFFARSFCKNEFKKNNLKTEIIQSNISFNIKKGTVRGMHFQITPFEDAKLVRCVKGSIFDIIVDIRKNSSTFKEWIGLTLSENNHQSIYIPEGFAHGFQTLEINTEVHYQMFNYYAPKYTSGLCWNDSAFSIKWPLPISIIAEKDNSYKKFNL